MRHSSVVLFAGAFVVSGASFAFESDVHFGLTKWLALKAGFSEPQALAVATGDQRVDSGDTPYIQLVTTYACLTKDKDDAALVERFRYPSLGPVPGPPAQRSVPVDSERAHKAVLETTKVAPDQLSFMLLKVGEAVHALQDSWSHQGVPDLPKPLDGAVACDPALAWAHPAARGGWNSHKADLTRDWPADTLAMAKATYDAFVQYPLINGAKRTPAAWTEIKPKLDGFIRASTKTDKKKWFVAEGISDVSFLTGTSLPDGKEVFDQRWQGQRLPPLATLQSAQHRVDADLRDFFSRLFTLWISTDDFDAIAAAFAVPASPAAPGGPGAARTKSKSASPPTSAAAPAASASPQAPMTKEELAARLKVWRVRDHGLVAELAHASSALSTAQRGKLASITKDGKALVHYQAAIDAFYPLQVKGPSVQPLLGFIIDPIKPSPAGNPRAVATTKFRHAPYDIIVVLAERIDNQWRVVSLAPIVDH